MFASCLPGSAEQAAQKPFLETFKRVSVMAADRMTSAIVMLILRATLGASR